MKIRSFFLLFFFSSLIYSQEIVSSLEDSISKYIYSNPEKAISYSHKYVKINKENNNIDNIIMGYSVLAVSHEVMSQVDSTLYYYYKRLSLVDEPLEIIKNKYYIARIYDNNYDYNEALRLYNQIIELAKKEKQDGIVTDIKFSIELIKTKVGLSEESLSEKAFNYLKNEYEKQKTIKDNRLRFSRKSLIEVYLKETKYKEALVLINEGLDDAKSKNNLEFLYYMTEYRSRVYFLMKEYKLATKDANNALDFAKQLNNEEFINEINYRLASVLFNEKKYEKVLVKLKAILESEIGKSSLQASKYYGLIVQTYKNLDSIRLSNAYYSKYIEEKEKASKEYLSAIESIHDITLREHVSDVKNSYEIELQEEKLQKEKYKKTKWYWIGISAALLLLIFVLVMFFRNKSKKNQELFEELMRKVTVFEERKLEQKSSKVDEDVILEKEIVLEIEPTKLDLDGEKIIVETKEDKEPTIKEEENTEEPTYTIDDKKVEEILVKLLTLEEKLYFLRQDCTLHNMSKRLKTNTTYLSKIINTHLGKSFSTYINELRINHAILELKNNKKLRSYSVKGIAQEMGYKNADAFTRYFKVATGITPAVYIKKIQEV